jgi:hypothetical protein
MILLKDRDYIISQPIDCKLNMFVTLERKFVDMMIQHMTEIFCSVNNTKSSELEVLSEEPSAIST